MELFGRQSETIEASLQELNVVRSRCLDYFRELDLPAQNHIFSFEKDNVRLGMCVCVCVCVCVVCGISLRYSSRCAHDVTALHAVHHATGAVHNAICRVDWRAHLLPAELPLNYRCRC